ncbi:uncharacterized protein [Ptychodera flava]|uniref:uncharacterized protein n=1 Tax=Ptychodera flava TaxID=63121 RepID=UPI00396A2D0E
MNRKFLAVLLTTVAVLQSKAVFGQLSRIISRFEERLPRVDERLEPEIVTEGVVREVLPRSVLTLTPSQTNFIDTHQDEITKLEGNPTLVAANREKEFIALTVDQQKQIFRQYGQFFKTSTPSQDFSRTSSNARMSIDVMQENGVRVCPVSTEMRAITLALTSDSELVQVVQLPDLQYQQLVFEEQCLNTNCHGVLNSRCVAVPRFVRACVIDLSTNKITMTDIQVECCACHVSFPWQ